MCNVEFKYEDLSTFCFICGLLGHSEKFREKLFETPPHLITKPYRLEMKAPPRRRQHTIGSKWLKQGPVTKGENSGQKGRENRPEKEERHNPVMEKNLGKERQVMNFGGLIKGHVGVTGGVKGEENAGVSYPKNKQHEEGSKLIEELNSEGELEVLEAKRKRPNLNMSDGLGLDRDVDMGLNMTNVPKNLIGAGTGSQARQTI